MKTTLLAVTLTCTLFSCHDGRTWESDTNGPGAQMADTNQKTDISKWPADNRTGNPAYHLRLEKEKTAGKPEPATAK